MPCTRLPEGSGLINQRAGVPQASASYLDPTTAQITELIFAGHSLAALQHGEFEGQDLCLCGVLSGDVMTPASHANRFCPVARFYAAVEQIGKVAR